MFGNVKIVSSLLRVLSMIHLKERVSPKKLPFSIRRTQPAEKPTDGSHQLKQQQQRQAVPSGTFPVSLPRVRVGRV